MIFPEKQDLWQAYPSVTVYGLIAVLLREQWAGIVVEPGREGRIRWPGFAHLRWFR
jgi:hypothetical protein